MGFNFWRFSKFCLVGISGIFVNQSLLWLLTEKIGIFYLLSSFFAIELAIVNNFIWNSLWTFKDRKILSKLKVFYRFIKYNITCWGGDFLNVTILYSFTEFFGIYYLLSNLFGIAIATFVKYFISLKWVFKIGSLKKVRLKPIKKPFVSLIIPTYNEKDNIAKLIHLIEDIFRENRLKGEIIVVDDNSPDGTWKVVRSLTKKLKNLKLIRRKKKLGLGSAVVEGFKRANGNILGVMDADFSHPPEKIPALVRPLIEGYCDLAIGSRYIKKGRIVGWDWKRRLTSKIAIFLAKPLTGIKDCASGFFLLRKDVINSVQLNPKGFKILLEILVKGRYKSALEIPYRFAAREKGRSKLTLKEVWNYFLHVLNLYRYKLL